MGASLTQGHAHLSSGCGFMVGLGKLRFGRYWYRVVIDTPWYQGVSSIDDT